MDCHFPALRHILPWVRFMIRDIWIALLLALHVVGVAATAYLLMLRLLRAPRGTTHVILLPLRGDENAQDRLYALHLRRSFLGEGDRCTIVALDAGLTEEQKRETARFCRTVPQTYCCTAQELPVLLQSLKEP